MRRVSFAAVLALAAVSLSAQNRPNQPTFRSGAVYIRVDMYATRDGRVVDDLKATDVEILEDGVKQTIDAFERVRVRPPVAQELRAEPEQRGREPADGRRLARAHLRHLPRHLPHAD